MNDREDAGVKGERDVRIKQWSDCREVMARTCLPYFASVALEDELEGCSVKVVGTLCLAVIIQRVQDGGYLDERLMACQSQVMREAGVTIPQCPGHGLVLFSHPIHHHNESLLEWCLGENRPGMREVVTQLVPPSGIQVRE